MSCELILEKLNEIEFLVRNLKKDETVIQDHELILHGNEEKLSEYLAINSTPRFMFYDAVKNYIDDKCSSKTLEILLKYNQSPFSTDGLFDLLCYIFNHDVKNKYEKSDFLIDNFKITIDRKFFETIFNKKNDLYANLNADDCKYFANKIKTESLLDVGYYFCQKIY